MDETLTLAEAAAALGVPAWRVRLLYDFGDLPEPVRIDGMRVLTGADLPAIAAALQSLRARWLAEDATARPRTGHKANAGKKAKRKAALARA